MTGLRIRFLDECSKQDKPQVLVVVVRLPNGALETIVNYQDIEAKLAYYNKAYDEDFKLKTNPDIQIAGFLVVRNKD